VDRRYAGLPVGASDPRELTEAAPTRQVRTAGILGKRPRWWDRSYGLAGDGAGMNCGMTHNALGFAGVLAGDAAGVNWGMIHSLFPSTSALMAVAASADVPPIDGVAPVLTAE
jgi:hypothetical protein